MCGPWTGGGQLSVIRLIQTASLRMGCLPAGLWSTAGKQLQVLLPLCRVILFRFILVELLEKLVGITVAVETTLASPGSNCATSSVVNAVIQNKLKNAAVTTRPRVAIRFHNRIAFSFSSFGPGPGCHDLREYQVLHNELTATRFTCLGWNLLRMPNP